MPRPCTPLPKNTEKHMQTLLRQATGSWETRRIQCVLMRASLQLSSEEIAPLVGLEPASVRRIWKHYLDEGDAALLGEKRGQARGNACLTLDDEKDFLMIFFRKAEQGNVVTASHIHTTLCNHLGRTIDPSTTFRMLKRHGWRKIVPLPEHPKGSKEERQKFKDAFSPTH